jgi:spore coat polysaccharide biosynthesis protein SpsF
MNKRLSSNYNNVVAIIQARMDSSRLPGKALVDLAGKPMLSHILERAKAIKGVRKVVLATCPGEDNRQLIKLADSLKIDTFLGPEENVLERYYEASEKYQAKHIIRITGDNPFTDPDYASMILNIAIESNADIASIPNLPLGVAVEVIKKDALDKAYYFSDRAYHFEHVTPYIKEHPELFNIERHPVTIKTSCNNLRLTIDTPEDYELANIIYNQLYNGSPFSLESVLKFLFINPDLAQINSNVHHRPMTHSSNG